MSERFDSQPRHHGIVQNIQDPDMRQWVGDFLGAFELDIHQAENLLHLQEIYNSYLNRLSFCTDDFLTQQVLTCMNYYFGLRKKSFPIQATENLQSNIGDLINGTLEENSSARMSIVTSSDEQGHQGQKTPPPIVEKQVQHHHVLKEKSDGSFSFPLRTRSLLVAGIVLALALSGRYFYQKSFRSVPDSGGQMR